MKDRKKEATHGQGKREERMFEFKQRKRKRNKKEKGKREKKQKMMDVK